MSCGIYKITCKETGRCYIGQSKCIEGRWQVHQRKRYPIDAFDYEILVTCQTKDLNELEILMIETFDSYRNGFNRTIGGTSIKITHPPPVSEETRRKRSEALKGLARPDDICRKLSEAGKKAWETRARKMPAFSEEHRRKLSEKTKAYWARKRINISGDE